MNCPQCHEPVGHDQFHEPHDWNRVTDSSGIPVAMERLIHVACTHCGVFELKQNHRLTITHSRRITDQRELRRIERLIPACRMDRRVAC